MAVLRCLDLRWRGLPFILPVLFTQHPARNTPVRLSTVLDVSPRLRRRLGAPIEVDLHVDDFSGSVLGDLEASPATRALVELARAMLHAYENPRAVTRRRVAELARQVDILLKHKRPDDVEALFEYVISVFEKGTPLRRMLEERISQPAREMYMTIKDELLAKGQRIGRKVGKRLGRAHAVLDVLEHREVPVSATIRKRVLAMRDELEVQRWLGRALTVTSAEELFEPQPALGRRQSSTAGARASQGRAGRRLVAA